MEEEVHKNTWYNTAKSLFAIIFPLITFPYIARVLSPENVGKINFGASIIGYFSLLASLGVGTYAIRECSKVRYNKKELAQIASQIISLNLVTTVLAYLALFVVLSLAEPLFDYRLLIAIQSIVIIFTTLGADWLNTAMEDFRYISIRTIGVQFISLVLMFIFIKEPSDYLKYAMLTTIAMSGANILNIAYRERYCNVRITLKINYKKHLPPILILFSTLIAQAVFTNSGTTILGLIKGDYEVGLYSAAIKIYFLVNTVIASIAWVVMPQLAANYNIKNYDKINSLLKFALNFIITLGIPCIVGMNVIGKEILLLLAGPKYLAATVSLRILTIALACSLVSGWISTMMLLPSGREKICLRCSIVVAVVNIASNLILIPKFGLNAAAFSIALSEFLGLCMLSRFVESQIHISGLVDMLKAPLVCAAEIYVISWVTKVFVANEMLVGIVVIIMSIICYILTLILMKNEFFLGMVKPLLSKFKRSTSL